MEELKPIEKEALKEVIKDYVRIKNSPLGEQIEECLQELREEFATKKIK